MTFYTPPPLTTLQDIPKGGSSLPSTRKALITLHTSRSPTSLTHSSLRQAVEALSLRLDLLGIPLKCLISIAVPNSASFIVVFLAITHRGNVAAPLNPAYTREEFAFSMQDAGAEVLVVSKGGCNGAKDAAKQKSLIILEIEERQGGTEFVLNRVGDLSWQPITSTDDAKPKPQDRALFLHTSGTTSRPKGVPLTHHNLATSIMNIARTYELVEDDCTLLVMPLFHVHGLMAAALTTLATGGCVAIPPGGKFSASTFWPSIKQVFATWYTAVPTIHQILLLRAKTDYPKDSQPKLRFIRSCSASLAATVLEKLESTFHAPVLEAYAMTEASHQMTSNPLPKFGNRKPGSVGIGQNVKIAILDQKNQLVPQGHLGEVCIQGDNVTLGYINGSNEKAFAGGWFHTGDQGFLDFDGYLTLTGRIKELINRGGEKISPLEVDAALLAHPEVGEAVSFAVPDQKYGEEVNAAVVLRSGSSLTKGDLESFVKTKLAPFKIPKRFFFSENLPRTATGKIQRRIVAKHFLEQVKT